MLLRVSLSLVALVISVAAQTPDAAATNAGRVIKIRTAQEFNGTVTANGELDGTPVQLACIHTRPNCSVPRNREYWIYPSAEASGPHCAAISLSEITSNGSRGPKVADLCDLTTSLYASKSPLTAEWLNRPLLDGNAVRGGVILTNLSDDDFDQTVVIEAVNEIGKAFTLGYQHFTLRAHAASAPVPFATTLPPGTYIVRADAVGEVASRNIIHRVYLQLPDHLAINTL